MLLTLQEHDTASRAGSDRTKYEYDVGGNRENPADPSEYDYGANNRLLGVGTTNFGYDGDGNLTSATTGEAYGHDAFSQLVAFSGGGSSASYAYDSGGRRVKKTVNGQETKETFYLWVGGVLLAEFDAAGNRTASYGYAGGWTPVQAELNGSVVDVHADAIGAVRSLSTGAGAVGWRARYGAYGSAVVDNDPDNNGSTTFNLRFPGQYFDAESSLHSNGYRTYDPGTGRFLQEDPLGEAGGSNLYAYAGGNPINRIDPTGTTPIGVPAPGRGGPLGGGGGRCDLFLGEDCGGDPPPPPPPPCDEDDGDPDEPDEPGEPDNPDRRTPRDTPREAARDVLQEINPKSIEENTEYKGWIVEVLEGGERKYVGTDPQRGTRTESPLGTPPENAVGDYHTHGGGNNPADERFTPGAERLSEDLAHSTGNQNWNAYLGTPGNQFGELRTRGVPTNYGGRTYRHSANYSPLYP